MEGSPSAPPAPADQLPTEGSATTAPGRRKLKRLTRISLIALLILTLATGSGFGIRHFLNARDFVITDDAQIDGDKVMVYAPVSGVLLDWRITQGSVLQKDQIIGRIKIRGDFAQPVLSIRAGGEGTVAVDNGVPGTFVTRGTQLAIAYNLDKIWVTARIDETDIEAVHVGQPVDITVDAHPRVQLTGRVQEIQAGPATMFSLFPKKNSADNFQKIAQVIPVKIGFENLDNRDVTPGTNVTVHIHKYPPRGGGA